VASVPARPLQNRWCDVINLRTVNQTYSLARTLEDICQDEGYHFDVSQTANEDLVLTTFNQAGKISKVRYINTLGEVNTIDMEDGHAPQEP
jgi:hypothetical protein